MSLVLFSSAVFLPLVGATTIDTMDVKCQCGTVAFKTPTATPTSGVYHCHCTECQKQSASAFGTSVLFPAEGIFPLSEDLKSKLGMWNRPTNEGRTMDCYFCKRCGARVVHRVRGPDGKERDTIVIKGGLIEGLDMKGATHIYVRSAVVEIPEGAVKWDTMPEPYQALGGNEKKD